MLLYLKQDLELKYEIEFYGKKCYPSNQFSYNLLLIWGVEIYRIIVTKDNYRYHRFGVEIVN